VSTEKCESAEDEQSAAANLQPLPQSMHGPRMALLGGANELVVGDVRPLHEVPELLRYFITELHRRLSFGLGRFLDLIARNQPEPWPTRRGGGAFSPCSSVPVRKSVEAPCMRCQRATASATSAEYR